MEIFQAIVELVISSLWPFVVVWTVWFLKDNIKDLLIKHKDTEVRVSLKEVGAKKAEVESLVNDVAQKISSAGHVAHVESINSSLARISELTSEIASIKEEIVGSLASVAVSGSNANGEYTIYNNGLLRLKLTFKPGAVLGETRISFPAELAKDSATVTFVGKEQPRITRLTGTGMIIELPETNREEIYAIVYGFMNS
ncbi:MULTISPECIES: hypothetical protein [Pseudomonas]|uniref:hypothetical protein n=1 Tax=Pseudomonas TaxID=286 RepID=UPI003001FC7D